MPPKKAVVEEKPLLGRPSNNVKIGLVGLPNVGKSSLFNLFGGLQVAAENYPFCTIDPAKTQVALPDPRFDHLVESWKPKSVVPAVLTVTDIAGLVKGAAEGKGLGNAFLSNIQAVDAIYHVARAFIDKNIEHVEGDVNPVRDFEIIRGELIAKDLEWVTNAHERLQKAMRAKATKEQKAEEEVLLKAVDMLKATKEIRHGDWTGKDIDVLNGLNLLTAKPVVFLVNISTANFTKQQNKWFKAIKEWVAANSAGDPVIPYSATFEQSYAALATDEEKKKFSEECKVPSMMPRIIQTGYKALKLISFFTTGEDEVRAWTIRQQTKAPQAAGTIHTDFEKCFICAMAYNYTHFKECDADEAKVKAAGHYREQGKNYVVQDGDILLIKENSKKGK
jgi:obg-like ATPase 1